ncbi:MAG: sulfatase [Myxococcota bacterium]
MKSIVAGGGVLALVAGVGWSAGCSGGKASAARREGPPPIVLLSMDTFRVDRIGAYGNPNGLTPNLDAFAAEAVVFENVYSQAVQTAPSHTSLFTSRYPSEQIGTNRQPYVPKEMPLLAELLSLYDYQTGAFVGGADLSPWRGLNKGFDTYEASVDFGSFFHTGPMALAWLDKVEQDRPYFLFVHGYDTHSRYLKPPPYGYAHSDARIENEGQNAARSATERLVDGVMYPDFNGLMQSYETELRPRSDAAKANLAKGDGSDDQAVRVTEADVDLIRDVYDGAVSYADTMVGTFLAGLEERGVLDEAVVVILADHGEQLGEHGLFGHCCEARDEEARVPLMVRLPGGEGGGRRVSGLVELVDVMPSLVQLADATPPARIHGRSFAAALRGAPFEGRRFAFTEGSEMMRLVTMRGPEGRLTYTGLSPSAPLLGDLVEAARLDGPAFVVDGDVSDASRAEMRTGMVTWLRSLTPTPTGIGSTGEMPEALKKSLREHGYWNVKE